MADLVDWYNAAELEKKLSPMELAALFHYRYFTHDRSAQPQLFKWKI